MNRFLELTPGKVAHASGALWLPQAGAALLADVHLGYGWAMRRRGQLGPVLDGGVQARLAALVEELQPKTLVFLGDVVHAPHPGTEERAAIESTLADLRGRCELVVVQGNHDRAFAQDFAHLGLQVVPQWEVEDLVAVHGDRAVPRGHRYVALGHYHPALGIRDAAGVKQKLPVFLVTPRVFVLPAFSPFAAGLDVGRGITPDLRAILGRVPVQGVAVTGKRAVRLGAIA